MSLLQMRRKDWRRRGPFLSVRVSWCLWQPKIAHVGQSKIFHMQFDVVSSSVVSRVWAAIELWLIRLAQTRLAIAGGRQGCRVRFG